MMLCLEQINVFKSMFPLQVNMGGPRVAESLHQWYYMILPSGDLFKLRSQEAKLACELRLTRL